MVGQEKVPSDKWILFQHFNTWEVVKSKWEMDRKTNEFE